MDALERYELQQHLKRVRENKIRSTSEAIADMEETAEACAKHGMEFVLRQKQKGIRLVRDSEGMQPPEPKRSRLVSEPSVFADFYEKDPSTRMLFSDYSED